MARCSRCNKFMLMASSSGYCKNCETIVQEEARRKAEEERKRQEEEARRKAEEERKRREEEARRKAEEERKRQEEEARRKAEEERKRQEEEARKKRELELKKYLEEAKRRYQSEQYDEETLSVLNNALKLATVQSEEWQQAQELLTGVKAKIAERENVETYSDALEQFEKADTLSKLNAVREILVRLANSKFKDSQTKLEECDSKIAEQEAIIEEKRRLEEEERKRQEEEARRKAEEEVRKRQEKILYAFASFPIRGEIRFGDTIQDVMSKDTRTAIAPEGDSSHLVFPDAVSSVPGGKTYYSFDENGFLKGMSYTYYRVFQRNPYDMGGESAVKKTSNTLLAGLKKKYGEPNFNGSMLLRYIKKIKGAQYQSLFSDADHYSGSSLWKELGLFSRDDANKSGIKVQNLSDMGVHSDAVRISIGEYYEFFGDQGWVVPVDGNYVVIHLVEDRRFRQPYVYVNEEMNIDIPWPFWFPAKPDYFVPGGRRTDIEIHFMDLVYVRYTKSEYNRILSGQKEAEMSAAKKAAEKEQKFLDEL